jgi:hypothetical protein
LRVYTDIKLEDMQVSAHATEGRLVLMVEMRGEFSESINLRRLVSSNLVKDMVLNVQLGGTICPHRSREVVGNV